MSRKLLVYALLYTGCFGRNVREEVDPLLQRTDEAVGVKEKRCPRVRAETPGNAPGIVGSARSPTPAEPPPLQSTINQHLCQTCQNRHTCRVLNNCEACSKWCDNPQNLQSRSNFEGIDYPLVTLSEGVLKDSITDLLGVEDGADVDRLTCSVTTRSGRPPGINGDQQRALNDPRELFEHVKGRIRESLMRRVKEQEVNCLSTEDIERLLDDILRNVTTPIKQDSVVSSSRASFSEPIAPGADLQPVVVPQALNPSIIEGTLDPSKMDNPQLTMENPIEPMAQVAPTQHMQNLAGQLGEFKTQGAKLRDFYQRMKGKASEVSPSPSLLRGKAQQSSENLPQAANDPTSVDTKDLILQPEETAIPEENPLETPADNSESSPGNLGTQTTVPQSDDLKARAQHLIEKLKARKHNTDPSHHHSRSGTEELEVTAPPVEMPIGLDQKIVDHSFNQEEIPSPGGDLMQTQQSDLASPLIDVNPNDQSAITESDGVETSASPSTSDFHIDQQASPVDHSLVQGTQHTSAMNPLVDENIPEEIPQETDAIDTSLAQEPPMEENPSSMTGGGNSGSSITDNADTTEAPESSDLMTRAHHLIQKLKARKQRVETYPSRYPYVREGTENLEIVTPQENQEIDQAVDPSIPQEIAGGTPEQLMIADGSPMSTQQMITGEENPLEIQGTNLGSSVPSEIENANVETAGNADSKSRTHHLIEKLKAKTQHKESSRYPYSRSSNGEMETIATPQGETDQQTSAVDLALNQEVSEGMSQQLMNGEDPVEIQRLDIGDENPMQTQQENAGEPQIPTLGSSMVDVNPTEDPKQDDLKTRTHHLIQKLKAKKHRQESYPSRNPYYRSGSEDVENGAPATNQEEIDQAVDQGMSEEPPHQLTTVAAQQSDASEEDPSLDLDTTDLSPIDNPISRTHHLIQKLKAKKHKTESYPSRYPYARSGSEDLESAIAQTDSSINLGEEKVEPLTTKDPVDTSGPSLINGEATELDDLTAGTHQLLEETDLKSGDEGTTEAFLGSEPMEPNVFMRENDNARSHHGHHVGKGHHHRKPPHHRSNERSEESDETSESGLAGQQSFTDPITEAIVAEEVPRESELVSNEGDAGDPDNFARNHRLLEKIKKKKMDHHRQRSNEEESPKSLSARTHQLMENIKEKLEKFNRNSDASIERPELRREEVKQLLPRHGASEENKAQSEPKLEEVLRQVETLMKNLERTLPPAQDQREILGSQPLENSLELYSVPTGLRTPPRPPDLVGSAREDDMYFISNGIKLPLRQVKKEDGALHLAIDLDRLCSCNNITCQKNETLARAVGSILEKEPELKEMLEEPELQVVMEKEPSLGSPHVAGRFLGDSGELQHENSEILKRSPTKINDIPKELPPTTVANTSETTTLDSLTPIQKSSAYLKEFLTSKLSDLRSKFEPKQRAEVPMLTRFQKWLQGFDSGQDSNVLLPLTKKEDLTFRKWLKDAVPGNQRENVDNSEQSNLQLIERELRDKMERIDEYNRRNGEIIKKESNAAESAILREEIGIMGNFLKWLKGVVNSNNSKKK